MVINIRKAHREDLPLIVDLVNSIFKEPKDLPPSMGKQFPTLFAENNAENLYLAENEQGEIISHNGIKKHPIVINGHQLSMASMGAVCTDPDYQGQGIATRILKEIFTRLKQENIALLTISGGRSLYTRQGAEHTSGKRDYVIEKKLALEDTFPGEVKLWSGRFPEELTSLSRIYQQENVRYLRSSREFKQLAKNMPPAQDVPFPPPKLLLSYRVEGQPAAYVLGYLDSKKRFKVVEYAGQRRAVIHCLGYFQKVRPGIDVLVSVPFYDRVLINMLQQAGCRGEESCLDMTYKIINLDIFLAQIEPLAAELSCEENFSLTEELPAKIKDDPRELLHFIFDKVETAHRKAQWRNILPLPLPSPTGLNFI